MQSKRTVLLLKLLVFFSLCFPALVFGQTGDYYLLVGTYTKGKSKGIEVYTFNSKTGKTTYSHSVPLSNPSYLCLSPGNKFVYAVSEDGNKEDKVSSFSFNAHTGALTAINTETTGGSGPCYVSTDHTGKLLFIANYNNGIVSAYHLGIDGSIKGDPQIIQDEGEGADKKRQNGPHAHSVVVAPDNNYLFAADLGTDKESSFKINHKGDPILSPAAPPYYKAPGGSGPRHFVFAPSGKFAYLIFELGGSITAFKYAHGKLDSIQNITVLPEGFSKDFAPADIHISADGKFLYGSDRGEADDISIFSVNAKTGKLKFAGRTTCYGKNPRNFALSPGENFLLVGNQTSSDLFVLPRNKMTGLLGKPVQRVEIGSPVCLKFAKKI